MAREGIAKLGAWAAIGAMAPPAAWAQDASANASAMGGAVSRVLIVEGGLLGALAVGAAALAALVAARRRLIAPQAWSAALLLASGMVFLADAFGLLQFPPGGPVSAQFYAYGFLFAAGSIYAGAAFPLLDSAIGRVVAGFAATAGVGLGAAGAFGFEGALPALHYALGGLAAASVGLAIFGALAGDASSRLALVPMVLIALAGLFMLWRGVIEAESGAGDLAAHTLLTLGLLGAGFASLARLRVRVAAEGAPTPKPGEARGFSIDHAQLGDILEYVGVGSIDWDPANGVFHASPHVGAVLDGAPGAGPSSESEFRARLKPEDEPLYEEALTGGTSPSDGEFDVVLRMVDQAGEVRPVRFRGARAVNQDGRPERIVGFVERAEGGGEADRDALTGFLERKAFTEKLSQSLSGLNESERDKAAVVLIDLDRLKAVNDALGHGRGDELIARLAERIDAALWPGDLAGRYGGDEFVIFAAPQEMARAPLDFAKDLLDQIGQPLTIGEQEVFPSASIGVATVETSGPSAGALISDAEAAVYKAKDEGRGRVERFEPNNGGAAISALALETDLRRALERDEIEVRYQPIIGLKDGRPAGFEALLRWRHPQLGLLTPSKFMGVADATGLITSIGKRVLQHAGADIADWRRRPGLEHLFVSINISSRQLLKSDLESAVEQAITAYALPKRALRVEITESQIMTDPDAAALVLERLKELGAGLALDDFGTGYSSLSHIQRFPFDVLKIDKSFVSEMDQDEGARRIVQAVVDLAHDLNMEVVGEGAESEAAAKHLRATGCDFAQGYIFGAAKTVNEASEFLRLSTATSAAE